MPLDPRRQIDGCWNPPRALKEELTALGGELGPSRCWDGWQSGRALSRPVAAP
jgi:hypothetical protein